MPNSILPALAPGDVLILKDGVFWIDRDWTLSTIDFSAFTTQELRRMIVIFHQILTNPGRKGCAATFDRFISEIERAMK